MSHPLVELSRTRSVTSTTLVVVDYDAVPKICRHGWWVWLRKEFSETVVLSFEHDPEELYIGWAIGAATVIDPGYSPGTPPFGLPVPGHPSVTYRTPVDGFFHRISFTSTPAHEQECFWVQALYRTPAEAGAPAHHGPTMLVCLSGSELTWPAQKLKEEKECLDRFRDLLSRYIEVAHVDPWDPIERWVRSLQGDDAVRVRAQLNALEHLDPTSEKELFEAIRSDLSGRVRWALMPGAATARSEAERGRGDR
jgi:hypothetical protein